MDPRVETYQREMAAAKKRGVKTMQKRRPTSAPAGTEEARTHFLERLGLLRRKQSLRAFGAVVGLPHTTVDAWSRNLKAQPSMADLRAIAERAELPGVKLGRLSVDWLVGLSDEPDRDARAEVGQLPGVLANHVAREMFGRLPRTGLWKLFVHYWRTDGKAIISQAVERELECFRRASEGLEDLALQERSIIEERVEESRDVAWPERGQSHEQRKAAAAREAQRRRGLVAHLVRALTHAEFVRRVNASGAALIYDPEIFDRPRAEATPAVPPAAARGR